MWRVSWRWHWRTSQESGGFRNTKLSYLGWWFIFSFKSWFSFHLISSASIRASNSFLVDLYRGLERTSKDGNIIISPFSVFTGLSLLHLGTGGNTREGFQSALHFPAGQQNRVHQDARKFINNLKTMSSNAQQDFILQTSNAVFLDKSFSISDNYRFWHPALYQASHFSPGPRWNVSTRATSQPSH